MNRMRRVLREYKKFTEAYLEVYPYHEQYPYNYCAQCRKLDLKGLGSKITVWYDGIPMERTGCDWHYIKLNDLPGQLKSWQESYLLQKAKRDRQAEDLRIYWQQHQRN
jgi:hypothetical protein